MKGMSLPIEMIVIIAISILVLVVIVAFFVGGTGNQMNSIADRDALTRGCTQLALTPPMGCNTPLTDVKISNYNVACGGQTGNLQAACCRNGYTNYDYDNAQSCQQLACRCPAP